MKMQLESNDAQYQIKSYNDHSVTVNEHCYPHSVLISPQKSPKKWPIHCLSQLTIELWQPILALQPQVVLLGTGNSSSFASSDQIEYMLEQGVGVECMTHSAACRTYTILSSEGRQVVAALILADV